MRSSLSFASALLAILSLAPRSVHAEPRAQPACTPRTLPSLGGFTAAAAIGDDGVIVGVSTPAHAAADWRPVRWTGGALVELPRLTPSTPTFPLAINDVGVILGVAVVPETAAQPASFTPVVWIDDRIRALPREPGAAGAADPNAAVAGVIAWDLNDAGEIVGDYADGRGCLHWPGPSEAPVRMADSAAGCRAVGINAAGVIATHDLIVQGAAGDVGIRSFVWQRGARRVLPPPASDEAARAHMTVQYINDRGDLLGRHGPSHVFWSSGGDTRLLPYAEADVVALNDRGTAAIIHPSDDRRAPLLTLIDADGRLTEAGSFPIAKVNHWKANFVDASSRLIALNDRRELVWTETEVDLDAQPLGNVVHARAYACQLP
jgi:hypothetical protein